MDAIISAIDTVTEIVSGVFDVLTGNAYLVVFLAVGLVGVGISLFRKLRNTAK